MARGLARRPPACTEHPHRPAADHCGTCLRRFCRGCLVRGRPQLLCRRCWAAAPEREALAARRRHLFYRLVDSLREHRASLVAGGLIVAVVALTGLSSAAQVLSPGYRAQIGEAVRAVRRGAPLPASAAGPGAGASVTPAPTRIPTLIPSFMGSAATIAELVPGANPAALTDGRAGASAPAWRSPDGFVTVDLRFPPREGAAAGLALFGHSTAAAPETWAKEVEVWVSLAYGHTDPMLIGRWTLAQTTEPQAFAFAPTRVASVRLRILSNYGSPEYTSLAEFALLPAR